MKQLVLALDAYATSSARMHECGEEATPHPVSTHCTAGPTAISTHIEGEQLKRLANTVLAKDYHDLTALAACNPLLIAEWQQAFHQQQMEAEQHARYWASAAAILATANGLAGCHPHTSAK